MSIDYYAVLGVGREAGADEIRRRFRDLARQRHPDRFQGSEKARAETEFQAVTQALAFRMPAPGSRFRPR
jgi:molecular chaperone DnaJ